MKNYTLKTKFRPQDDPNLQAILKEKETYKAFQSKCSKKMKWKEVVLRKGAHVIVRNAIDFKKAVQHRDEIGILQIKYFNWDVDTTRILAGMYSFGIRVILGNHTEVKSTRWPRPYIVNATPEELAEVRRVQTVQNNKTCNSFIKEVAYILTKGFKTNPLKLDVDYGWVAKKYIPEKITTDTNGVKQKVKAHVKEQIVDNLKYVVKITENFPQTENIAYFTEGVQNALLELKKSDKILSDKEKLELDRKRQLYCEGLDFNKHYASHHVHYTHCKEQPALNSNGQPYVKREYTTVSTVIEDEVYTWSDGFRSSKNHSGDTLTSRGLYPYQSDIKTTYEDCNKMAESEEALKWLEEHDMLDLHSYHCPICGNVASTFSNCDHCGYELPEEAKSDFNNGRITREELETMSVTEIENIFVKKDTSVAWDDWRSNETDDFNDYDDSNLDVFSLTTDYE